MTEPIQHHTVPAGYLSGFLAESESQLHVYTREGKHYRGKPESLSSQRYYHSVRRKDGTRDNSIEQLLANSVEPLGFASLRKLEQGKQLTQRDRAHLCVYMAIQLLRTPHMRGNFERTFAALLDQFARQGMRQPGVFEAALASKRDITPQEAERLAKEARDSYLKGHIQLQVKPEYSLLKMFEESDVYAEAMAVWKWEVVTTDESFITSDCPVHFASSSHAALLDPKAELHFPLTSNAFLIMRFAEAEDQLWSRLANAIPHKYLSGFKVWHNYIPHRQAAGAEVKELNKTTAAMAEKAIYVGSETNDFDAALSEESENIRFKVTAEGDELRLTLH